MARFLIQVSERISGRGERAVAVSLVNTGKWYKRKERARHLPCRRFQEKQEPKSNKGDCRGCGLLADRASISPARVLAVPDAKPFWDHASVLGRACAISADELCLPCQH